MVNLNQIRAKNAFSFIESYRKNENLMNIVKRLPEMIHNNGLLATFAFLMKKQDERGILVDNLLNHLREEQLQLVTPDFERDRIFDKNAGWVNPDNLNNSKFFAVTDEMIKYAVWLKRAAEALATEKQE